MNLIEMVGTLQDFRRKEGRRYPLAVIMLIFREILKGVDFDGVLNGFNKWASA